MPVVVWVARISIEIIEAIEPPNYGLPPMCLHLQCPFAKLLLPPTEIFSDPWQDISRKIKTQEFVWGIALKVVILDCICVGDSGIESLGGGGGCLIREHFLRIGSYTAIAHPFLPNRNDQLWILIDFWIFNFLTRELTKTLIWSPQICEIFGFCMVSSICVDWRQR